MADFHLTVAGEDLVLTPERAIYWPARRTLVVADLHWAKSEALQKAGIPLPGAALATDLDRLAGAAYRLGAERILVLGDLVHAPQAVTPAVTAAVAAWRQSTASLRIDLIRGNHDRRLQLPEEWAIGGVADRHRDGPFMFTHGGQLDHQGVHGLPPALEHVRQSERELLQTQFTGLAISTRRSRSAAASTASVLAASS